MNFTLAPSNPQYPQRLKEISDPPQALYIKARSLDVLSAPAIAVVGTRTMTPYGQEITRAFVAGLVKAGLVIVSGLALGVDTEAHRAAINCGGKTVAVLGCGIDFIYPPSNARLYQDICENGAVISEHPGVNRPPKDVFKARNRIISGLSLGVLVIEGQVTSGSLITARYAAEQGREVFAVPGPVTSQYSRGPSLLINNGAKLVETVADIIDELNYR